MAKKSSSTISQKRKPRLLWANPFCLLDTSSGASMTVRQMLHQLVKNGYEVQVLGCTIFDNPKGMGLLKDQYPDFKNSLHQLIEVEDGDLSHQLVVTARTTRNHLTTHEEGLWHSQYLYLLDSFKPDIVWFYGGQTLDLLIPDEARARGIPSAFYLANGNYKAVRWCRDIDLILTDSQSTADMYRTSKKAGFAATPVGKFIDPANFVAETHERKRLLFVNPSWQKGASVVVQLALALEQKRPDIQLEVVEARADWSAVLRETTQKLGEERATLPNVVVTPNTSDMRGPYSRARLLLAPSLWWESSGRVLAEAMLNGIPALITNRGGMPEMIGDAGIAFDFPEECYEAPHQNLLSEEQLQPLYDTVLDFYDDTALYEEYVQRAWAVGKQRHHIDQATERLTRALAPFVKLRAGNKDFTAAQQKRHRQGLASIASKPKFKVDASLQLQNQKPGRSEKSMPLVRGDFDWQIEGKIIVLDSRAKLLKMGAAENLTKTGAFGIIAFDPASEVSDPKQYEGSETTQVFQHALLGDGNPATLHTCLDASMSSTLEPLPQEELPGQYQQGSQVLTKLPINTIALDSIEGLPGLDWLILDELSDTATILEHGQQALKETLIIQARVAFQPTHKHQPSLTELQHWASRNGFRFYRFNNMSHHSLFPENNSDLMASELESADVLFLPTAARLEHMSAAQHRKLAFLLDVVFKAHDLAYSILEKVDHKLATEYLTALTGTQSPDKTLDTKHIEVPNPKDLKKNESSHQGESLPNFITEKKSPHIYSTLLEEIISSKGFSNIVQIGANDGKINDPIYDFVTKNNKSTKIGLIEPQANLIPFLKNNYKSHPDAEVLNCAIGPGGSLTLHRVKPSIYDIFVNRYLHGSPSYRVPSGFASFDKDHVLKHIAGNLPPEISSLDAIESVDIPCYSLLEALKKLGWEDNAVDVIQVDTEGMDDLVIYECSISEIKPSIINFEHSHLSSSSYKNLCKMLHENGYSIYKYSRSDTLATTLKVNM